MSEILVCGHTKAEIQGLCPLCLRDAARAELAEAKADLKDAEEDARMQTALAEKRRAWVEKQPHREDCLAGVCEHQGHKQGTTCAGNYPCTCGRDAALAERGGE